MLTILPRDNKWRTQEQAIEYHNNREEIWRTQEQAIEYHNNREEIFMSVADACQLAEENPSQLKELQKDFMGLNWSITSTRIDYKDNKVIHHTGSTQTNEIVIQLKEIPICRPTYLKDLISTFSGFAFIKALANKSKATKAEIIQIFELLSRKKAEKIRFWTPTDSQRKDRPFRAVLLYFDLDWFSVIGNGWGGVNVGLSRGVKIDSAPKEQGKSKQKNKFKDGYNQAIDDIIKELKRMKKS